MLTNDSLLQQWQALPGRSGGGYRRVDAVHPLDLYIGYEAINQKTLLMVSSAEPSPMESSKSIVATAAQRADGMWALSFRLVQSEQEAVFIQLCCDLIESSRSQQNDAKGLAAVVDRYKRWHKLMEHQGSGLLSESARKGLLGELLFMQRVLVNGMPVLDAVSGWRGPDQGDRDFVYPQGWHEIKTVVVAAKTVTISSLEQLDAPLPGELVVFFIDKTAPGDPDSFSLNGKVSEIMAAVQSDPAAYELLDSKLEGLGYLPLREYDMQRYRLSRTNRYRLDDQFPRLIKAQVPSQIADATYAISLGAIERWRTE